MINFGAYPVAIAFFLVLALVFILIVKSGKKKRSKEQAPHFPKPAPSPDPIPEKQESTFDSIQSAIAKNPKSAPFRADFTDTANYSILDLTEYMFQKSPLSFVAFDLETTGLSPANDAIVEIGAVRVVDGQITEKYHQLVNPMRTMPAAASAVNNITDDMLNGMPQLYEILPDFLHFAGSDILVAHNAKFDSQFIAQACMRYRLKYPKKYFDTMQLTPFWPDLPNRKLVTFLAAAGVVNSEAHRALSDAEALANLMIIAMNKEIHIAAPDGFDPGYSDNHFSGTVEKIDNKLEGKRFVVTGVVDGYEREDLEKLIQSHGGKATLRISNATDFLIRGTFGNFPKNYISSTVVYARKLISEGGKIRIISPSEFFKMLEDS